MTNYNRTHQSINSELIGMYQPGILEALYVQEVNGSFPPNEAEWKKRINESLYAEIFHEIDSLGNSTIIHDIPIFNVHPFEPNRTFNMETNCKNLDNIRLKGIEGKDELLYGYFVEKQDVLREFFQLENNSYFTNIKTMNSIVDHYISDYKNYKDLSAFHNATNIDLDEFMNKSGQFYYDWMYNYYCPDITCSMESSRLMEDLLGYMKRRIQNADKTTYYAPKLIIDCGHDTTVAPMEMFMYEAWKHKPEYGLKTQYCGFACNLYFELYRNKNQLNNYYVYYYIDDELIKIFDYDEFDKTIRENLYSQEDIEEYCLTDEDRKLREKEKEKQKKKSSEKKIHFCGLDFLSLPLQLF